MPVPAGLCGFRPGKSLQLAQARQSIEFTQNGHNRMAASVTADKSRLQHCNLPLHSEAFPFKRLADCLCRLPFFKCSLRQLP
ncbi:hypothetical protein D3C80_1918210 [compost metagenome]